jgi:hypothetical protein
MNIIKKYTIEEIVIALLFIAGILTSLTQFLYNRSLWFDESTLALNIISKNSLELLKPLNDHQVAPVLFLQIEKLFSTLLPNTEYGLRLFPLLCFWFSIYFFYKIIKIQLQNIHAIIIALSLFVFNAAFVYYSSEVKQYMTDVFVLLAFFYFILKDYKQEKNRYYILGIAGVISIYLSNVAPIILFTGGFYLLYEHFFLSKRHKIVPLFAVFAAWLGVFSIYYCFFIHNHPTREYMLEFWQSSFLPHDSISNVFSFLDAKRIMIFRVLSSPLYSLNIFSIALKFILIIFFLTGIIDLIRKKAIKIIILTCIPPLLHLFLSTFRLYPFEVRLILYTLPCIIIICSFGFLFAINIITAHLKTGKYRILIISFPILFFFIVYPVKILQQEFKGGIQYIQKNRSENEGIYIHTSCFKILEYYKSIGFIKPNFMTGFIGKENNTEIVDELKNLHGKNWLLFADIEDKINQQVIKKADSLNYKKIKTFETRGGSAYLYDFGE